MIPVPSGVRVWLAVGGNLVLARRARELLECQLYLVKQSHAAFRARAVKLPRQFCDLQLLMGNQGFIFGSLGFSDRQLPLDIPPCCADLVAKATEFDKATYRRIMQRIVEAYPA